MEKIDKSYAIIYIDRSGDSIEDFRDYMNKQIATDYYDTPGSIQWNYYLIANQNGASLESIKRFETDDHFCRKYAMRVEEIDPFVAINFPELSDNGSTFYLYTGDSHTNAWANMSSKVTNEKVEKIDSIMREFNEMNTLTELDRLRASMLNEERHFAYFTHLTNEINLIERKFGLLGNKFKKF